MRYDLMSKRSFSLLIGLILILTGYSCKQEQPQEEPKIEIYLTNRRIPTYIGYRIPDSIQERWKTSGVVNRFDYDIFRFDPDKNNTVHAGPFIVGPDDLEEHPLITNEHILSFNMENGDLTLDSLGVRKLFDIGYTNTHGKQFTLMLNDKPLFNGYFYDPLFQWSDTYHYFYHPDQEGISERTFELYHGFNADSVDIRELLKSHDSNPWPPLSTFRLGADLKEIKAKMTVHDTVKLFFDHSVCEYEGFEYIQITKQNDSLRIVSRFKEIDLGDEKEWFGLYDIQLAAKDTLWQFGDFLWRNMDRAGIETDSRRLMLTLTHQNDTLKYYTDGLVDVNRFLADYYQTMRVIFPENTNGVYGVDVIETD